MAVDQRWLAGQRTDLSKKLAGTGIQDRRDMAEPVALARGHMSRQDDMHAARLAGLEHQLAVCKSARLPEPPQAVHFLRRQPRESLLVTLEGGRRKQQSRVGIVSQGLLPI